MKWFRRVETNDLDAAGNGLPFRPGWANSNANDHVDIADVPDYFPAEWAAKPLVAA